jgi:hypothetical protein
MSGLPFAARKARFWPVIVLWTGGLWTSGLNAQTCLVLSPATIAADGVASLDLSLYSSPGTALAAVQWTFRYPSSSIGSLTVDDGPMLTSAGKTAICAGDATAYTCLAVGASTKTIGNGIIARVTAVLVPGAGSAAVALTDSLGASSAGNLIPIPLRIEAPAGAKVSSDCKLHTPQRDSVGSK